MTFEEIRELLKTGAGDELQQSHPELFTDRVWAQIVFAKKKEDLGKSSGLCRPVYISHDYFLGWIPEDGVQIKKFGALSASVVIYYDHETETFHTSSAYTCEHADGWVVN